MLVVVTWVWVLVGSLLTVLVIGVVEGAGLSLCLALGVFYSKPYLASYAEIVGVGLLPLVLSVVCRDDPGAYGLGRKGVFLSLLLSLGFAAFKIAFRIIGN